MDETEILVVDNGSTEQYPWDEECDTYLRFKQNRGISAGWNAGLKAARGKYLVIIGDDILVRKGWLEALREAMAMPQAGMVNPQVEHLPPGEGIVEDYKWPSGACFMLTKSTINRVGYFDEEIFPCNTEDWDYWIRLYKAGLRIYKNHRMTIQHREGATVHEPTLSAPTGKLLERLNQKYGFNAVELFCGGLSMSRALSLKSGT